MFLIIYVLGRAVLYYLICIFLIALRSLIDMIKSCSFCIVYVVKTQDMTVKKTENFWL
jgi:hypothetical protein